MVTVWEALRWPHLNIFVKFYYLSVHTHCLVLMTTVHLHALAVRCGCRSLLLCNRSKADVSVSPAVSPAWDGLISSSCFRPCRLPCFLTHSCGRQMLEFKANVVKNKTYFIVSSFDPHGDSNLSDFLSFFWGTQKNNNGPRWLALMVIKTLRHFSKDLLLHNTDHTAICRRWGWLQDDRIRYMKRSLDLCSCMKCFAISKQNCFQVYVANASRL